jgi:hypothetical protein
MLRRFPDAPGLSHSRRFALSLQLAPIFSCSCRQWMRRSKASLARSRIRIHGARTFHDGIRSLHRWTFHRTVGAKDAAVARLRAQQRLTVRAFVEKLAGVGRHCFALRESANRAHQHRFKKNFAHTRFISDLIINKTVGQTRVQRLGQVLGG